MRIGVPSGLFDSGRRSAQFNYLSVYESPPSGRLRNVWDIVASRECTETQPTMRYGLAPAGFINRIEPEPLQSEVLYRVEAGGCGYHGFAYFIIRGGDVVPLSWKEAEALGA